MFKKFAKIIAMGVLIIMVIGLFTACGQTFTETEHIQRITERVESRFFSADSEYAELYTDFSVELLYNAMDEPAYFMVEFEPSGFLYGIIDKGDYYYGDGFFSADSITGEIQYHEYGGSFYRGNGWKETGQGWCAPEVFSQEWTTPLAVSPSTHQDGNFYFRSHYKVACVDAEKKYMHIVFFAKSTKIAQIHPIVKRDGVYVCVVSGRKYESTWFKNVSKNKLTNSQRKVLTHL